LIKKGIYAEFVETENLPWIDIDDPPIIIIQSDHGSGFGLDC